MRVPDPDAVAGPGRHHTSPDDGGPGGGHGRRGALTARRLLAGLLLLWACGSGAPLPVLGTIPDFALTECGDTPVTARDLDGDVWIADFIFTRCPDVCPVLTGRMSGLQSRLPAGDDPVKLVSLSVDPTHDTPTVLRDYASRYAAGPSWLFLTGSRDAIKDLLRDGFKVAFADDGPPTAPITHSDRFVLVDRQRRVRGYYHGSDAADLDRLVADAQRLHAARDS